MKVEINKCVLESCIFISGTTLFKRNKCIARCDVTDFILLTMVFIILHVMLPFK